MVPVQFFLPQRFYHFSMVYYCGLPLTNLVMVILYACFYRTKFSHGTTFALLSADPTFYQRYHHFRITVKVFLYLINFVWMFTFKVLVFFILLHNWQEGIFSTAWFASAYPIYIWESSSHWMWFQILIVLETNNWYFRKYFFVIFITSQDCMWFLLFLKPIIGTWRNTFLWYSSWTMITCSSFN